MKNTTKQIGIIALVAVIGFFFTACGGDDGNNNTSGNTPGGNTPGNSTSWTVNSEADWGAAINGIRSGGNDKAHVVTITGNISVLVTPLTESTFGSATGITVTLTGNGTLTPSSNGQLLVIYDKQTVIVRDLTLRGRSDSTYSVVWVNGGTFIMEGGASVAGNTNTRNSQGIGGVVVYGTFTMRGNASVTNCSSSTAGGVGVAGTGTFTMEDNASVANNTGSSGTGGVLIENGTFTMRGGTVSGNTGGGSWGGGVSSVGGTFTMYGGAVSGNTGGIAGGVFAILTMYGGTISGNTGTLAGGVFGSLTKTGGTIYGNDAAPDLRNTTTSSTGNGHAVCDGRGWRNTTAGPQMNTETYGFWEG